MQIKFCSEAYFFRLEVLWRAWNLRLGTPSLKSRRTCTQDFYVLKKSIDLSRVWYSEPWISRRARYPETTEADSLEGYFGSNLEIVYLFSSYCSLIFQFWSITPVGGKQHLSEVVLMRWSLLPNALRPFKIYCASPPITFQLVLFLWQTVNYITQLPRRKQCPILEFLSFICFRLYMHVYVIVKLCETVINQGDSLTLFLM